MENLSIKLELDNEMYTVIVDVLAKAQLDKVHQRQYSEADLIGRALHGMIVEPTWIKSNPEMPDCISVADGGPISLED